MACLTTATRAALIARRTRIEALIIKAEASLDRALDTGEVESYRFDSGEGSQQTRYRSLEDIQKHLDYLYSRLDAINRRLGGVGIINMNLRRKAYSLTTSQGRRY